MKLTELPAAYAGLSYYPLRDSTRAQLDCACRGLADFAGLDDCSTLNDRTVSAYVDWLIEHRSQSYARSRRNTLLVLWRFAWREEIVERQTRNVRAVRPPRVVPKAFTRVQVQALIVLAERLPGQFQRQFQRLDYRRDQQMTSLIRAAYETGFRLGDLLRLTREDITDDGTIEIVQSKTGVEIHKQLSGATIAWLLPEGRLWPLCRRVYQKEFTRLCGRLAFHPRACLKWLRRSHGTHVELDGIGDASEALGHTIGGTKRYYVDQSQFRKFVQPKAI